ncbi:MAG: response regulator [Desulfovibrionaceae bacterium]|nr:response regulator [Desulfovibrionaceae bacterium]
MQFYPSVVVIDDSRLKRQFLVETLKSEFAVHDFASSREALPLLASLRPQCILLDMDRPGEDGLEDIRNIKADPYTAEVPVIFITSFSDHAFERRALASGASDFVGNKFSQEVILARVKHHVELYSYRTLLEEKVREKTQTVFELQDAIMMALSELVECRDSNTAGHAQRTRDYVARLISQLLSNGSYANMLTEAYVRDMVRAAPLHDIGKVGVRDAVLNKPGKLTEEEFDEMKRHTVFGAMAINKAMKAVHDSSFLSVLRDISLSHHERWDGKGYPLGLNGDRIPLSGRIMAIADVYDALVSRRPYKDPLTHEKAVEVICEGVGTHFDPLVGKAFLDCAEDFREISQRHRS